MKMLGAVLILCGVALLALTADPTVADDRKLFGLWQLRHLGLAASLWLAAGAVFAASRSRSALLAYVFAGVLAAATIGLLEVPGFAGWVSYPLLLGNHQLIPTNALGTNPTPRLDVRGETFMDTATSWGITHEPIPFHFRTDHRGFRNSVDLADADIYLVGDSVVVGALVDFEDTVTARLGASLGRPVMNVSVIAVGPEREHELFRNAGLPVAGRLVLQFLFEGNDLLDTASYRAQRAGQAGEDVPLKRRSFLYNLMLAAQRWSQPVAGQARRQSCSIGGRLHTFGWIANSHRGVEDQIAPLLAALADFGREIEAGGGRYAVVFVPSKLRALQHVCVWPAETILRDPGHIGPLRDALLAWSGESGVAVVDLTQALQDAATKGDIPWFWGDTHWNATGHRVAAEVLAASAPVGELPVQAQPVPPSAAESPRG